MRTKDHTHQFQLLQGSILRKCKRLKTSSSLFCNDQVRKERVSQHLKVCNNQIHHLLPDRVCRQNIQWWYNICHTWIGVPVRHHRRSAVSWKTAWEELERNALIVWASSSTTLCQCIECKGPSSRKFCIKRVRRKFCKKK